MFTGIIEEVGCITKIVKDGGTRRIEIESSGIPRELKKGDSVSVSGVCLTAIEITLNSFSADLAQETWERTSFSHVREGASVNLELPMRANGRFDGHIVQGHVDGTGVLIALERIEGAEDYWLRLTVPSDLARYVIAKGSLTIEGISLTVAKIDGSQVTVAIIPHTAEATNLKSLRPGDPLNLEVDLIAKYVEKMVRPSAQPSGKITIENLVKQGF